MHLLYVLNVFPRLSETFILDQITALIDKGHEVSILAYHRPENMLPPDGQVPAQVYRFGLLEHTFYFGDQIGPIENLYGFQIGRELADALQSTDLIVAHFANTPAQVAERLSAFSGKPYVFVAHAYDIFVNPDRDALQERAARAAKILVPTEFNRQYLMALLGYQYAEKIQIIRYGVNLEKFTPGNRENIGGKPVVILSVGRLVEKKGYPDTIKAFAQLSASHPEVVLRIAGDGPCRSEIEQLIAELNLKEQIHLLGNCSHDAIQAEMQAADIFVLASCTARNGDREGLPVAILEASAMELPVVSTLHTGIPEGVLDGQTGFLVPEHDVNALVERLAVLIQERDLRLRMGKLGRQVIRHRFNLQVEVDKLITVMLEASHPHHSSPTSSR